MHVCIHWLAGAAPAFDDAVLSWLRCRGFDVQVHAPLPRPRVVFPALTRLLRIRAYSARWRPEPGTLSALVLPYLAGDALVLAGSPGATTLGVALGSDLLRPPRSRRARHFLRGALLRMDAVWSVSEQLAGLLTGMGRRPDWVAPVGVNLNKLPPVTALPPREPGRILSARNPAPIYRRQLVRAATASLADCRLIEPQGWPHDRMIVECGRAAVVVSMPLTDGAPATVMEAICMGAHVIASGGPTVREWLEVYGGTYGEPESAEQARTLLEDGLAVARQETPSTRLDRARRARAAFSRDATLAPLEAWLQSHRCRRPLGAGEP